MDLLTRHGWVTLNLCQPHSVATLPTSPQGQDTRAWLERSQLLDARSRLTLWWDCQYHTVALDNKLWLSTPQSDCQYHGVTVNTPLWLSTPLCESKHHIKTDNTTLWLLPPHCDCDWRNTVWPSTAVRSTIMIQTAIGPLAFMACLLSDSFLKLQIQGPWCLTLLGPRVTDYLDKSTK